MAEAASPRMLIPIHTEHRQSYIEHFDNVHMLPDEKEITIP
jgi:hypothetical protein